MIRFKTSEVLNGKATLIEFKIDGGVTTPEEAFSVKIPDVSLNRGVIISGRGPIWLYGRLIHYYHPARWVAVYDPRLGAVVVQSHTTEVKEGEVIEISGGD